MTTRVEKVLQTDLPKHGIRKAFVLIHEDVKGCRECSVTRLDDFLKFLVIIFLTKLPKCMVTFCAILKNITVQVKISVDNFWVT